MVWKERCRRSSCWFACSITPSTGANEDDVTAAYHDGILEVAVGLKEAKASERRIAVEKKS